MKRHCTSTAGVPIALLVGLLLVVAPAVRAVVIRQDRSDADTLELGQRFTAVGRVLPDGGCTLVAPTWVATAAHVAAGLREKAQVQFGDRKYDVKRVVVHPDGGLRENEPPEVDLALLELVTPVEGVAPAALYAGKDELGKTLFIVGNGDYGFPAAIHHTDGKRRAVTNVVHDAGPRRLFMRFDAPPEGTALEGVGAAGDSGGPALLEDDGKLFLAGVSSGSTDGKPGQYGVVDVYTRVGSYVEWIEGVMKPVAATPEVPASPAPPAPDR